MLANDLELNDLAFTKTTRQTLIKAPVAKIIINDELVNEMSIAPALIGIIGTI